MKSDTQTNRAEKTEKFVEGVDYYFENGLMILTKHFLSKRGYCCRNGCLNCPYTLKENADYNKKTSNSLT